MYLLPKIHKRLDKGLEHLRKEFNAFGNKSVLTEDLVKMSEFVLKNNYFEINLTFKHQISGTAIGTKFAPLYACIFLDYIEKEFLKSEDIQPWIWFWYIDDTFFIWTASEKEVGELLNQLNSFNLNLRFIHEPSRKVWTYLTSLLKFNKVSLLHTYIASPQMAISIFIWLMQRQSYENIICLQTSPQNEKNML